MNILVKNLPVQVDREEIETLFNKYGKVTTVLIQPNGNERRHGVVVMDRGGKKAIKALNGYKLDGEAIVVEESSPNANSIGDNESMNE